MRILQRPTDNREIHTMKKEFMNGKNDEVEAVCIGVLYSTIVVSYGRSPFFIRHGRQ
jgi:hypothetical protein